MEAVGFDPQTSPPPYAFTKTVRPTDHGLLLNMYMRWFIFKIKVCNHWRGVGPGLSPGPWSFLIAYIHTIYAMHLTVGAGFKP